MLKMDIDKSIPMLKMDIDKTIQTIIDFVGYADELTKFGNFICTTDMDIPFNIPDESKYNLRNKAQLSDGIVFTGTHWLAMVKNKPYDSCQMNLQIKNSDNFCQTFAILNYILESKGESITTLGFQQNEYTYNIMLCASLWLRYLKEQKRYRCKVYSSLLKIANNENNVAEIMANSSSLEYP